MTAKCVLVQNLYKCGTRESNAPVRFGRPVPKPIGQYRKYPVQDLNLISAFVARYADPLHQQGIKAPRAGAEPACS